MTAIRRATHADTKAIGRLMHAFNTEFDEVVCEHGDPG